MTIEEGEEIYGKRWSKWTKEERAEFAKVLEPKNLRVPGAIALACDNFGVLSEDCKKYLREHGFQE